MSVVGRVASLHRYPVKSMRGQTTDRADVTARGLAGDRAWGLVDRETGRVVSAKRPRRWGRVFELAAEFLDEPVPGGPAPAVRVRLPDGSSFETSGGNGAGGHANAALDEAVTAFLGRPVSLESESPEGATFEYHWPDMEGMTWKGRARRDELTVHDIPPGTFFDSSSVVLLTTATLTRLAELEPEHSFEVARFRPNLVIETDDDGFVENDWVGGTLAIGDDVRLEITRPCMRCVMVNLAQPGIEAGPGITADPEILKAVFRHNDGNVGVKASVVAGGSISAGDPVHLVRSG